MAAAKRCRSLVVALTLASVGWGQSLTTVAGGGAGGLGDGGPATSATLLFPNGIGVDAAGNLFISDGMDNRIRRVDAATGVITTVAGNGSAGFSGDGGAATSAQINFPFDAAVDSAGNVFIADGQNNRIRMVAADTGLISTFAGSGSQGFSGDGGPATSAALNLPFRVALDAADHLFIADAQNSRVRRVDRLTGIISTVAGNGSGSFSGDGGPATAAGIGAPFGIDFDAAGNLAIASSENTRIRLVTAATGIISTVAGNGGFGFAGDGGPAVSAVLGSVRGVAFHPSGAFFFPDIFSDSPSHRVRRVDTAGIVTTVAGSSTVGFAGDGGPATSASLDNPFDVAISGASLFIADRGNARVRRVELQAPPANDPPMCVEPTPTATILVSAGAAVQFDVAAVDAVPSGLASIIGLTEQVAPLEASGKCGSFAGVPLSSGIALSPPLPVEGQPAVVTFTWVPSNSQAGCHDFTFGIKAESSGLIAQCKVRVVVQPAAECFLLIGRLPLHFPLPFSSSDTLLVLPELVFPVTSPADTPTFTIPDDPTLLGVHLYSQVYMDNPAMFPGDPWKLSNGVDITLGIEAQQFGASTGLTLSVGKPLLGGQLVHNFTIDG